VNKNKVRLALGTHNHQPVGNFAGVMAEAYERCYAPFLELLDAHPAIRMAIHHSGCLLEWIEAHQPEYIEKLGKLVERNQLEILGGGFYEPILTAIPHDDALEQLTRMNEWARRRLGAEIRGIWLTERIWEPSLPVLLREAGIEYTIVDESHFRFAGIPKEKMVGYYSTERWGNTTAMFPIDKVLRYKIPFDSAENNLAYIREIGKRMKNPVVTYADDGEKFGIWPETYEWVYEKQWLEKFFVKLEQADDIDIVLYREVLDADPPTGRLYLPTASYHEMTEWSLPVEAGVELMRIREQATRDGHWDHLAPFVRGGFWDNFLAKYPEANRMHKRMLRISQKLQRALAEHPDDERLKEAQTSLLRGQCNCAYWHGLFGGLYLNYLRDGVFNELYAAEEKIDAVLGLPVLEVIDHDADGNDDVVIDTEYLHLVVKPSYGGSVYELVDRRSRHHLTDVLARRREIYHSKLSVHQESNGEAKNPHEVVRVKEKGLAELLFYDWFDRYGNLDHFLAPWTDAAGFATVRYGELGDFVNQPYQLVRAERVGDRFEIEMTREGGIYPGGVRHPLRVTKTVSAAVDQPRIDLVTTVTNLGAEIDLWLARQWNFTLLTGMAEDRWIEVGDEKRTMGVSGIAESIEMIALNDAWKKLRVEMRVDEPTELWHFPVETVSQSEGGFERTYQGTAFAFCNRFRVGTGESKALQLTLTLGSL